MLPCLANTSRALPRLQHGMDSMRMAALAMLPSARNSLDIEVLYGCWCSPACVGS